MCRGAPPWSIIGLPAGAGERFPSKESEMTKDDEEVDRYTQVIVDAILEAALSGK
jgi:hypothetical protein